MNKKFVLLGVLVLVGVSVAVWTLHAPSTPVTEVVTPVTTPPVSFYSINDQETIAVAFEGDRAELTGLGYEKLPLASVVAASGARYFNETENVEVWTKGEEITVSQGIETLFVGSAAEKSEPIEVSSSTEMATLLSQTWMWTKLTTSDDVVTPMKKDVFTITFTEEGTVSGTTDCNSFSGTYTENEGVLVFSSFISTKMFCEGSQERVFIDALTTTPRKISIRNEGTQAYLVATEAEENVLVLTQQP